MKWKKITVGPVQENTYIIYNSKNEAVIIDPGVRESELFKI